ncbi:hypothetical protein FPRO04_12854 [Fusarium proliferatum]|nr:hypothetical protein FPRO03_10547 [Fusarium proliferatum]KAG4267472.1 hypothetical protein FPRO04_12854 [Fusarium proliferatum]
MTSITEKWVRHPQNCDRQKKERLDPLVAYEQYQCFECGSQLEHGYSYFFLSQSDLVKHLRRVHPIPLDNYSSLVSEVKTIYAGLAKVEEACTQIEQRQPRNSERDPDPNLEQWEALQALHRTLLHEHNELPIAASSLRPQLRDLRKIAYDHSLQSRSLRRFSDCLLPRLKREQDYESARQWLELMKLSSSLIEILWNNDVLFVHEEEALTNIIEEIEAILSRLKLWFRCRYEDLSRKKDVTEEQGLFEPIFEFPNNIRHTCTTMPWTILPALLVLWGVCWMFIIGSSESEHEWRNAVDPMISPVPATYDFNAKFYGVGIEEGNQGSVADGFDNRGYLSQDTLEELWPGDVHSMNDLIHPLIFAQHTPQDPNFLIPDMTSRGNSESLELAAHDTAEISPAATMKDSTLTACINTNNSMKRDATGSADSSGFVYSTINSDDKGEETKAHLEGLSQHNDQPRPRSTSTSTSASAGIQHREEFGPDEAIRTSGMRKRPRAEEDEESNDKFLLAEMVKKYKKLEKEIKEKQDDLKALGKTIQMLERS